MFERLLRLTAGPRYFDLRAVRVKTGACPACGTTVLVRLARSEFGVRCLRCGTSAVTMSLVRVLKDLVPNLAESSVYELSARGPLYVFLKRRAGRLIVSEYFDDIAPGSMKDGVRCEDVQALTFPDATFDVCTSTEVLEHVPDDARAFAEIHRVLRTPGTMLFTVPLSLDRVTVERARLEDDQVVHLLPPRYHDDHVRGMGQVLCYRNYGSDIVDRLRAAGFSEARIVPPPPDLWWGHGRPVVMAEKL